MSPHIKKKEVSAWSLVIIILIVFLISFFLLKFTLESNNNVKHNDFPLAYEYAFSSGNLSNCDLIENISLVEVCKIKLGNCSDDNCFEIKAKMENDEKLCFKIKDPDLRAGCSLDLKRNSMLEGAVLEDDISVCERFEDVANRDFCRDNYYLAKRFNHNDLSYCSQIKLEALKNECFN
jgi:hypothetical protein